MASFKSRIKEAARRLGYRIQHVPPIFRERPDAEISLTLEHVVALQYCLNRDFFFVQVGAFDGSCVDPIHAMVQRYQWRGLLIEPEPRAFASLQATYRNAQHLTLLQAAISDVDGKVTFYRVKEGAVGLPSKAPLVSSLDRKMLLRNLGESFAGEIEAIEVQSLTLKALFQQRNITHVDLLQIDAEGYDFTVLKSLDFSQVKPAVINFEHALLSADERQEAWRFLVDRGYKLFIHEPDTIACVPPQA